MTCLKSPLQQEAEPRAVPWPLSLSPWGRWFPSPKGPLLCGSISELGDPGDSEHLGN